MSAPEQLIIFVKAPLHGTVKTRLARTLGHDAALQIYLALVRTVLDRLPGLANVQLRFTPDAAGPMVEIWRQPGWTLQPQGEGDLGARMHRAFADAFAAGAKRVVLIGSDCPEINAQDIRDAWQGLESHDAVLGPANDGGYWLIGLRAPQGCLFEAMQWSTENVLTETLARAHANGLNVYQLRMLPDVDTAEDWQQFQARATPAPPAP